MLNLALRLSLSLLAAACVVDRPVPIPTGLPSDCGGTGTERMRLAGNQSEEPAVWLVGVDSGRRYTVIWPSGYSALFRPHVELRNRLGVTIARDGDMLEIEGDEFSLGSVSICRILAVNQPIPTAMPVPTRRPPGVPPPAAMGMVEIEVCGETHDYEPIDAFLVRFEPLEGQPGQAFPVAGDDCQKRQYQVAAGRYIIEVSAQGWQAYRTDIVEVRPGRNASALLGILLRPDAGETPGD
jgi:hypothetical protein